ncbi:MAG: deoxyribonuclease IV [Pirellulaceae bacterium]|nr:deoxyribonuclease IV [Planctomycetales bacterium]
MSILGVHMSIAGGYYRAVERAREAGCDCVQVFTKNNNQWRAKLISDDESERFRKSLRELKISHPISHSSYLINIASPDKQLWRKSVDALLVELQRAGQLSIPYVVLHPGAYVDSSEAAGIRQVVKALNEVNKQRDKKCDARCLLETTAGQGSCLGWRFEQLAEMLEGLKNPDDAGICLDTCHLFAAGYPLATEQEYRKTMRSLNRTVGIGQVKAVHLNDSKRELGSRVDRHEHIGRGCMGLEPFRRLLCDRRFRKVPMYLETPKGTEKNRDLDVVNLKTLRGLIAK